MQAKKTIKSGCLLMMFTDLSLRKMIIFPHSNKHIHYLTFITQLSFNLANPNSSLATRHSHPPHTYQISFDKISQVLKNLPIRKKWP